jgi:hypothetical protein
MKDIQHTYTSKEFSGWWVILAVALLILFMLWPSDGESAERDPRFLLEIHTGHPQGMGYILKGTGSEDLNDCRAEGVDFYSALRLVMKVDNSRAFFACRQRCVLRQDNSGTLSCARDEFYTQFGGPKTF